MSALITKLAEFAPTPECAAVAIDHIAGTDKYPMSVVGLGPAARKLLSLRTKDAIILVAANSEDPQVQMRCARDRRKYVRRTLATNPHLSPEAAAVLVSQCVQERDDDTVRELAVDGRIPLSQLLRLRRRFPDFTDPGWCVHPHQRKKRLLADLAARRLNPTAIARAAARGETAEPISLTELLEVAHSYDKDQTISTWWNWSPAVSVEDVEASRDAVANGTQTWRYNLSRVRLSDEAFISLLRHPGQLRAGIGNSYPGRPAARRWWQLIATYGTDEALSTALYEDSEVPDPARRIILRRARSDKALADTVLRRMSPTDAEAQPILSQASGRSAAIWTAEAANPARRVELALRAGVPGDEYAAALLERLDVRSALRSGLPASSAAHLVDLAGAAAMAYPLNPWGAWRLAGLLGENPEHWEVAAGLLNDPASPREVAELVDAVLGTEPRPDPQLDANADLSPASQGDTPTLW